MTAPLVAGIELGGTKCIAALARGADIVDRRAFPTGDPATTIPALLACLAGWSAPAPVALGLACFGPLGLDPSHDDFGKITTTPKPGWSGADVRGAFAKSFAGPIGFDTDVNGAALAEGRWGAARGADVHVYLTIGTGIGGGVVVGGKSVHGLLHPEIGHIRVRRDTGAKFAGVCPYHGDCIEGLVSGPAIAARTGRPGEDVADDDPVWREVADELAELIALLLLTLSPNRILIGGGLGIGRAFLLPMIRAAAADRLGGYLAPVTPEALLEIVRPPALGVDAGPLGAAALALDALGRTR